jgi:hypothetical protein
MPDAPVPAGAIFRQDPVRFVKHYLRNAPACAGELIRSTAEASYAAAALLALLAIVCARWQRLSPRDPSLVSIVLYTAVFIFFLAVQVGGTTGRYFNLVDALLAVWLAICVRGAASAWAKGQRGFWPAAAFVLAALYLVVGLAPSDLRVVRDRRAVNPFLVQYTRAASLTDRQIAHGTPVVVGFYPYIYTVATGAQALTIPEASDDYLRLYMDKYHARTVLLSDAERAFWRPAWQTGAGVPQWLHPLGEEGGYWRYRIEPPADR